MKKFILSAMVATSFLLASCQKDAIRGSGPLGSRTISLPAFTKVEAHYDISANINYGPGQEITATGYENLLDILDFSVENETLLLKYNANYRTIRNGNVMANIQLPLVSKAAVYGSKNIVINGFDNSHTLEARIHGSGNIMVTGSQYEAVAMNIYGSGNIEAQGLQTKDAVANIYGSGSTFITVSERLQANIFGSGNVNYWGTPVVRTEQHGSGRAIRK